jgi:hypothetical protein
LVGGSSGMSSLMCCFSLAFFSVVAIFALFQCFSAFQPCSVSRHSSNFYRRGVQNCWQWKMGVLGENLLCFEAFC